MLADCPILFDFTFSFLGAGRYSCNDPARTLGTQANGQIFGKTNLEHRQRALVRQVMSWDHRAAGKKALTERRDAGREPLVREHVRTQAAYDTCFGYDMRHGHEYCLDFI